MKKITQNLTNVKAWQSTIFAFMFLFSLTINSQEVGQEYLVNPGINTATGANSTTPETGVDGGGNFPANLGGWTNGTGGAYASASTVNGDCHSADRMFKFFKVGGPDGQFVNQTITALPAGNYNWSFYSQWGDSGHANGPTGTASGNLPSWSAEGDNQPKFTILVQDADGAWVADQATVMTEPSTVLTWVQDSGTWTNTETRDVRIKFAKNGGTAAGGGSNTDKLMYVDDASLTYASALSSSAVDSFPYCTSFDTDLGDWTTEIVSGTSDWTSAASNTTTGSSSVDAYSGGGSAYYYAYNYSGDGSTLMSTAMDISSVVNPQVTFQMANPAWGGDQETLQVWYKAAAGDAWTVLATYTDSSTSFSEVTVGLPNASSDYYIAFNATSGYGYGVLIDDVCVDAAPTEPAMSVTATTDGGSATFSFTIDNFTVGAAAGEGDGHIHWSIFSASDLNTPIYDNVMVYSTDDLTLSPLPNGDHVIVFSLVDANHQPLDPAVEATVEFSTFDGTAACGETVTYTQVANGDYTVALTAPAGEVASVTINATMEANYDHIYVYDGAGTLLNTDQDDGTFTDAVYSSSDGTISVNVTNDGSVQNGDVILAFSCAVSTFDVTFSVNTANIEVGPNGMYVGGGVLGGANAYAMSDDDGDGTWTVTVALAAGTSGNYTLLNSPNDGGDWGAKEDISGQECADAANYNDRILAEVTGDITLLHCFGTCDTDGTCSALAVDSFPYCSSFDADLGDWTAESVSGDTSWSSAASNYNGSVVPLTGAGMAYLYDNSSVSNLVSLPMDISSLASPQVTFSYAQPVWAGDQDELRVWYKAAAGDEWSQIAEYTADTQAWETVTLDLPNASSDYYLAFNGTAGYGYGLTIDDVCVATAGVSNEELLAFLGSGSWRSEAETAGHIGVGPSGSTNAEWWNANAYDKADTGLYDDRWSFADGVLTVDTGDDGAIFGKKAEIDAAFPDNTPYDADNGDNEYLYYIQDDYTDTFVADATNNTITFATNGNLGFFTSVAGQEFQILETTDNTVYLRNVGSEGNAWYNRLTTADALSTVDAMVLDMRIYPNPSNGSYVTIQTPVNGVKYVEVFDITGKRLINTTLSADTLNVSSMSSGMYLVKVTVEGQSKTSKLIIR
ncbi:T9SS type A sorting domain-containing protein [Flavobacteriaceae bacterium]|nr:T9SS type A sorting domain-containing protein [Flavobacteriaceae bacterium]